MDRWIYPVVVCVDDNGGDDIMRITHYDDYLSGNPVGVQGAKAVMLLPGIVGQRVKISG